MDHLLSIPHNHRERLYHGEQLSVHAAPHLTDSSAPIVAMCVDVTYKFACGCRVSPAGAPYREMCVKAASTNRACWVATSGQRDELWHGTEVCPAHKGKKA